MSIESADSDDWALARIGQGQAFGRIFDRHRDRVYRHSFRLAPSPSEVDDIVAIVFFEAWRRRDAVRLVDGSVLPWLLVTATNVASNVRRSAKRHRALLDRLPPADTVADHAERLDDGDAHQALRGLAPADQQVIVLCVLEGLSEREASLALRVPAGTVKSRLSRAKKRLASHLPTPLILEEATHDA